MSYTNISLTKIATTYTFPAFSSCLLKANLKEGFGNAPIFTIAPSSHIRQSVLLPRCCDVFLQIFLQTNKSESLVFKYKVLNELD